MATKVTVYTIGEIYKIAQSVAEQKGKEATVEGMAIGIGDDGRTRIYVDYTSGKLQFSTNFFLV